MNKIKAMLKTLTVAGTLLASLMMSSMAWAAESETKSHAGGGKCKVENRVQSGFTAPKVYEFGDMKLKVEAEHDDKPVGPNYYATFSLKAPGFLKRGINMKVDDTVTYMICGTEVSIHLSSASTIEVSSF